MERHLRSECPTQLLRRWSKRAVNRPGGDIEFVIRLDLLDPPGGRHQHQSEAIPPAEEAVRAHLPSAALGVVGIDHLDGVVAEIDERDDVLVGAGIGFAEADRRPQVRADSVAEDVLTMAARILDAIGDARVRQTFFQVLRGAQGGVLIGQAVHRLEAEMSGQRLQGAPTTAPRRAVLHPAGSSDFHFRLSDMRDKQR